MRNLRSIGLVGKLIAFIFVFVSTVNAQETCGSAVVVTDLTGVTCATSAPGTVDNLTGAATCPEGTLDTWFSFTAQGGTANITVSETISGWRPEFVVISSSNNTCGGTLFEEACFDQNNNYTSISGTVNGLVNGDVYWVLVTSNGNLTTGTISVCVNNPAVVLNCVDNDACLDAATITLNAPGAGNACVNDCNNGANPGIDFVGNGCEDSPNPTVWYEFTTAANAAAIDVTLTSASLTQPEFTIYVGNACGPWTVLDCIEGTAGSASSLNIPVAANQTYVIAVSDVIGGQGSFDLCINQDPDNSACNTTDALTVTATSMGSPLSGPYQPGEQVTFCYSVTNFTQFNCNYIGAFVPSFGNCWDPASFNAQGMPNIINTPLNVNGIIQCPVGPPGPQCACAGSPAGAWSWFPAGSATYNINGYYPAGTPMPAGWYYLSSYNPATGSCTGDPTDPDLTYGDGNYPACGTNTFDYTVCFTLIAGPTGNCGAGLTDCSVTMKTFADGEFGAWNNIGCTSDAAANFPAGFACCTAPVITPIANQSFCSGGTASASLTSDQDPGVTYSWTVVAGANISGAAAGSGASISQVLTNSGSTAQTAVYTITANNGSCSSTTTFTVTVNPIPTVNDPADQVLCAGASTTAVTFTGNSGSTTYNWTNTNTTIGLAASGSGNIASFATINAGITAQVATITVTPVLGTCIGTAQTFTITVNPVPTVNDPADQVLCANQSTTAVTFSGNSGATTYNWTNSNTSIGLAASGTGNIASFTATNPGATAQVANIIVTPVLGTCTGTTQTFTITVNPVPTVNDPADQALCAGAATTAVNFTGNSGSTTYNWTNNNTSIGLGASGSGNIASFTSVNAGATAQVATITVTPVLGTCTGTAQTFTITVNPVPTVNDPADQTLCANQSTTAVTFSGNSGATTYNWTNSNTSIGLAATGSGNIASFTATNAGATAQVANIIVTPVLGSCTGTTQTFTITVNPVPTVNDPADQALCAGAATTAVNFAGNSGSTTYNWTNTNTSIGLAASGTGNIASFTSVNAGATAQIATITVTPVLGACTGTAQTFTITVNPVPTVNDPSDQTLCANQSTTAVTFSGNSGATTYNWTNTNTTIGLAASGSGNIASFTALNAGSTVVNASITVTPVLGTCTGTSQTFSITVNPVPTVNDPADQTLCAGTNITAVTFTGNSGSTTYNWTNSNTSIGLGASGSGNIAAFAATNASGAPISGNITVTPVLGTCTGTPQVFTITVNPIPTFGTTFTNPLSCGASNGSITLTGLMPSTGYTLSYSDDGTPVGPTAITSTAGGTYVISGLNAGGYSNIIISNGSCNSLPASVSLSDPSSPSFTISLLANTTTCGGTDGAIHIEGTGTLAASTSYNLTYVDNGVSVGPVSITTDANGDYNITGLNAGTYTGVVLNLGGCIGSQPGPINIVDPTPPTATASTSTPAICEGSNIDLQGNNVPGATYAWSGPNLYSSTNEDNTITSATVAASGTYSLTITLNNCPSVPSTVNIAVNALPVISGTLSACVGATSQLSATTAPAATPWTSSNNAIATVNATGLVTAVAPGSVTITYTNSAGCTDAETFTVNLTPTVTDPLDQTLCANTMTSAVNYTGNNGATTYNWTNDNTSIGLAASGSGNITSFSAINAGITSQVANIIVTPSLGTCTGTPQTFVITVNPVPTVNDPADQSTCAGGSVTGVTFSGNSGASTYGWTNDNTSIGLAASGSGNIASFTGVNAGSTAQVANIVVTPTLGSCSGTTQTFTITVNPVPTVNDPSDQTMCAGSAVAAVNFSGNSGATTYNWSNSNTSIGLAASGSGNIASFTSVNAGATAQVATIIVTPVLGTCTGTAQTFTITVNPVPTVNDPADQALCAGGSVSAVTFTGNSGATSYGWTNDNTTVGLAASGSGNITSFTGVNAGSTAQVANVVVTPTLGTCVGATQTFTITVNPIPTVNDPADQTMCAGASVAAINFSGNSGSTTYNWANSNTSIGLAASGSGNIASFTSVNAGATTQVATITVTPLLGTCTGTTQTFTITVEPVPTVNDPADQVICAGDLTTNVVFSGNIGSTSYDWTNDNTTIGLAASGSTTVGQFTGVNSGSSVQVANITVTPTLGACVGAAQVFSITVNPLPSYTVSGASPTVCNGSDGSLTISGLTPSTSYDISYDDDGVAVTATVNTDASGNIVINGLDAGLYDNFSVILTSSGCEGLSPNPVVLINPGAPIIDPIGNQVVCDSFTLPVITGTGLSGTESYWTGPSGTGTQYFDGNSISTSQTLYIYDSNGGCSDETSFVLTVNLTPVLADPGPQVACGSYTLPTINGTNLTGNEAYYNNDQTSGATMLTGSLTSSQTVWIYDSVGTCFDELSFTLTINPLPTVTSVDGGATYCAGDAISDVTVAVTGTANWTIDYTLDGTPLQATGSASPVVLGTAPGVYVVNSVSDAVCSNSASGTQTIIVNPIPPAPIAGTDSTYCTAWTLAPMTATGTGGTLSWFNTDPSSGTASAIGTGSSYTPAPGESITTYYVWETSAGCTGPASSVLITIQVCDITIPTAITPDNDTYNDDWEIVDLDAVYPDNVVRIYNRWGNLIFEHDSSVDGPYDNDRWKGTYNDEALPVGSYYYIIDLNDKDNTSKTGTVSILK